MESTRICETPACNKPASLQCPTCLKSDLPSTYFCSQECFKSSWKTHKAVHKKESRSAKTNYNPWPSYFYTGVLRPYPLSPHREVPPNIARPDYADHPSGYSVSEQKVRGSSYIRPIDGADEEERLRTACRLGREVLEEAGQAVAVGVTTDELDRIVHEACIDRECYPSPLNYYQFPKSCCTSVNEVICHGIPDARPLANGDICNIDVTVYHRGFHGDLNETYLVGDVSTEARRLVEVTWQCLEKAIAMVKPGEKYREVGNVIQRHASDHGLAVVRSYCGHGIHKLFHCSPNVPHYAKNKAPGVMKPGHCFTIEPMISQGTWRDEQWSDKWTAVTADGKLSAQFEHTLLVTDTGCDILTARKNSSLPFFLDNN